MEVGWGGGTVDGGGWGGGTVDGRWMEVGGIGWRIWAVVLGRWRWADLGRTCLGVLDLLVAIGAPPMAKNYALYKQHNYWQSL